MASTWATFTCSLVFLILIGGVCSIEVVDASGEEAVSLRDDMTHSQRSAASLQSSENREPPANGCMTGGDQARRTSQQSTPRVDSDQVDFDDSKSSNESEEKNDQREKLKNNHNDKKKRRKTSEKSSEDRSSDGDDDDDSNNDDDAAADDDDNDKKKNKGGTGQRTRETIGVTFAVLLTVGVMFTVTAVLVFLYCYFTHRPDTRKLEHRSHGSACNTYSLPPVPVGSQPRPPESSPVATPLGEASSRQTISTEDVYELVDETEYLHPTHGDWVPVKKPRDTGVGCQQYSVLQRRASRSDDGVSAVKDRRTENHAYTHLHQPGDSHNDLEHDSKSAPDVVRLIRRRTNCKSLEPLHAGSPACTGDTSDSSSSVDTPTSAGYSLQKPVMEVYPRAIADTAVMAPAAERAYMIPIADTAVMAPAADTAYMIPAADTAVMAPAADTAYMIPIADTAVMAPADDRDYMIPATDRAYMIPAAGTAAMAPAADTAAMAPAADRIYFVSAGDNGQGPAADRGGDDMDAAAEVYSDPSSGQSCSC